VCIYDIQRAGDSATYHAHDDQCEEEIRPEPAIPRGIVRGPAEPIEPRPTQHELRQHKYKAELRFVDAVVPTRERIGGPVGHEARQ
jgi:hypothetical protein